jgi:PIN domain nuclease of toxin-antitoxin system
VKLLLDTHIWVWSLLEPERLTERVRAALTASDNELWLSPISTWEAMHLVERGRIESPDAPGRTVERWLAAVPVREAPLTHQVALATSGIVLPHQDPADRFLVATARLFDLTLVTADARLLALGDLPVLANH